MKRNAGQKLEDNRCKIPHNIIAKKEEFLLLAAK